MPEHQTVERVYLDGTTLVIETAFGRTTVGLREQDIKRLREGLAALSRTSQPLENLASRSEAMPDSRPSQPKDADNG